MKRKLYYSAPYCILIDIGIKNSILYGSNEGGGGNENYDSDPLFAPFEGFENLDKFFLP